MLCWCWQESLVTDSKYWPVHHVTRFPPNGKTHLSVRPEANIYVSIFFPQAVRIHQPCMSCLHRFHILHIHCIIYTTNHLIINNLPQRSSSLIKLWHLLYLFALSSLHDVTLAALSNVHYTVYIYCPVCIYWKKKDLEKKGSDWEYFGSHNLNISNILLSPTSVLRFRYDQIYCKSWGWLLECEYFVAIITQLCSEKKKLSWFT